MTDVTMDEAVVDLDVEIVPIDTGDDAAVLGSSVPAGLDAYDAVTAGGARRCGGGE